MKNFLNILPLLFFPCLLFSQAPPIPYYEQIYFNSEVLSGQIPVQIHLPADYEMNMEKYQVHYVLDGILASRMYAGIADHYTQLNLMPEIIVIGVNMNRRYGQAEFCKFLDEELIPFVDSTFRTVPFRLLAGHSSSGELTLYELFSGSGKIQGFIAGSPTGLEKIRGMNNAPINSGIKFIYTSIAENDFIEIREQYPLFVTLAEAQFHDVPFYTEVIPGLTHHTCFPVIINNALLKLYKDWPFVLSEERRDHLQTEIESHTQQLSDRFGYQVQLPEKTIFRMAYQWIYRDKDYIHAIDLLKYGIQKYPGSGFIYHLMGKAHHLTGEYEQAEEYYLKALERIPDYQAAKDDYELLKKETK